MSAFLSVIIYLVILFGAATFLYVILTLIFGGTHDPLIAYLLTLILTHLFLMKLDRISKDM
jgi:hypothetical protein